MSFYLVLKDILIVFKGHSNCFYRLFISGYGIVYTARDETKFASGSFGDFGYNRKSLKLRISKKY